MKQHSVESRRLGHNGAELAAESAGAGDAVVFLHAGVADRRMWREQTVALSERFRTIAYDRRGFGGTSCADVPFSHGDDLEAVMDHFGIRSGCVVGCSQGGRIAIDFALAHPQRVDALVLIAPAISGAPEQHRYGPTIDAQIAELEAAEAAGDINRVNAIEVHLWLDGPAAPEGRVRGPARDLLREMNGITLRHPPLCAETRGADAYPRLHELAMPALVIWGALDFPHITANCRHLVETLPRARGVELDDVAHLPSLEQPARLNELLQDFLLHGTARADGCGIRPRPQ